MKKTIVLLLLLIPFVLCAKPKTGTLIIETEPNVKLYINGIYQLETTDLQTRAVFTEIEKGKYTLMAVKDSCLAQKKKIRIKKNKERIWKTEPFQKAPKIDPFAVYDTPPILLKKAPINYPEHLKKFKIAGKVTVSAEIYNNGSVGDVKVLDSPHQDLNQPVIDAVKQYWYKPAKHSGRNVDVIICFSVVIKAK